MQLTFSIYPWPSYPRGQIPIAHILQRVNAEGLTDSAYISYCAELAKDAIKARVELDGDDVDPSLQSPQSSQSNPAQIPPAAADIDLADPMTFQHLLTDELLTRENTREAYLALKEILDKVIIVLKILIICLF